MKLHSQTAATDSKWQSAVCTDRKTKSFLNELFILQDVQIYGKVAEMLYRVAVSFTQFSPLLTSLVKTEKPALAYYY